MKRGFYTIMAAQFFSSLADNALFVAAVELLRTGGGGEWQRAALVPMFALFYVILAPWVGAFADARPKGQVMFMSNAIKIAGCLMMLFGSHPLLAYAVVGLGAAAYSPAKYGILTELLPPSQLVKANGWIEGLTIGSIILGVLLGGQLVGPRLSAWLLGFDLPGIDTPPEAAIASLVLVYAVAAAFNLRIPHTGVEMRPLPANKLSLLADFRRCNSRLWRDRLGQISLATTTLFWGAGATLQFIVLDWARHALGLPLNRAAILQGVVALGIAIGAMLAARLVRLRDSLRVLPVGVAMGLMVPLMTLVSSQSVAYPLLVLIGAMAGFFVVPMNALLQHRGHVLMSAGHSIAVQNFNENLNILLMLGLYSLLLRLELGVNVVIVLFGAFVALTMLAVMRLHRANQRVFDSVALIGQSKH